MRRTALLALALLTIGCPERRDPASREAGRPEAKTAPAARPQGLERDEVAFNERKAERDALVAELEQDRISDPRVLAAMRRVPRHAFVPEEMRAAAYQNRPLPIGHGQTISQPLIVAAMTQAARPKAHDKCLEIGTGSGYQAAVLAEVCGKVYSIEYLKPLADFAAENLRRLGYGPDRVELRHGDGYKSWPEAQPFDVVLVTAAPEHVPEPLLAGLAVGGRLVIPVGPQDGAQHLELWIRKAPGAGKDAFEHRALMDVRFVPFLGDGVKEGRR